MRLRDLEDNRRGWQERAEHAEREVENLSFLIERIQIQIERKANLINKQIMQVNEKIKMYSGMK
jgi:hypothetical protein